MDENQGRTSEERPVQPKPAKAKVSIWVVVAVLALIYVVMWAIGGWQRSFELATGGSFLRQLEVSGILPSAAALREERIAQIRKRASEAIRGTQQDGGIAQTKKKASAAFEAARQNGRLAQIRKKAEWHGRIYATLMVLGLHAPLFSLLVTTIGIILRLEGVGVRRLLITLFFVSWLWGTTFSGAASFTYSRLAMSSGEDSFIILLGGQFMVWTAVTGCFGLIIAVAALVRRLLRGAKPKTPTSSLKSNCPQCGRSLRGATQEMVGDTGVCPKCKAEFVIGQVDTEDKRAAVCGEEFGGTQ